LIDTDVGDPRNQVPGGVHDIVMNPKTDKIAYLVIARHGIFGFDTKYVPIPRGAFRATRTMNLLVLDATSARMDAAPDVSDDQFAPTGHFDQESQKMDAYWTTRLARGKSGGSSRISVFSIDETLKTKEERSMSWSASGIKGYAIAASDGKIGTVSDFLFDDDSWLVRWLVVDTGHWLPGRKVLPPPLALGHPDPEKLEFPVRLSMTQVKESPNIKTDRPVSRQMKSDVYDYHGWRPYWGAGFYMGGFGYPNGAWVGSPPLGFSRREEEIARRQRDRDDPRLRGTQAVTGYHVHASDGEIGHVEDFLVEDTDWSIHYLVVDTKNWWPGKKVLISPASAHDINWTDGRVNLNVDRQKVRTSPEYSEAMTIDRDHERRFHNHYHDIDAPGQP